MIYKSSTSHPDTSYQVSIGLSVQNDFSYFDLLVTSMLSIKTIGLLFKEEKRKIDFHISSIGGHLGFPIGTILAIFDLLVILMLPTKI